MGVAVSVAVGVAVTVDLRARVGARSEAEDGRKKLNKHANTPAASSSAGMISRVRHRVFNMSSSALSLKVNGSETGRITRAECKLELAPAHRPGDQNIDCHIHNGQKIQDDGCIKNRLA